MEAALKENKWLKELEKPIIEAWKKEETYKIDLNSKKKLFSIDTPPPYVNTPIHIGHATTYVLMDMFARFRRMKEFEVLFPLGLDRNGLPIEIAAEKKFNVNFSQLSREKILEYCEKLLSESSTESIDSFLNLGIGFNSYTIGTNLGQVYLTDSDDYRALTQGTFIDLWNKGLIYEDERINNYCPGCRTTIADAEIDYKEISSQFSDVIFKCKETGEDLIIGTTRPELIPSIAMVIFHPEDERYKKLEGKTAITPLFGIEVPIKAHPFAKMDKGTGLVMMCSAGDTTDIWFFREQGLKIIISINQDGLMNKNAGFLEGLKVKDARKKMIELLREKGLIVKETKILHRTPVCERSNDEIEFIAMKEFYVKQVEFKDKMRELARELNFFADSSRQILLDWIDSVTIDWPISRRRYYATEVPLWYCKNQKCKQIILPPKGKYFKPWKEKPPIKECPKCKGKEFEGETRVFDTWFDSSISPLYILGYERFPEFFKKHFQCSLRPQGKEIVRTWLYYTVLKDFLLTGKVIFKDVWINYHIVDEKGIKMSKRLGNVIDPHKVLEKFGAEPFRLWCAVEGSLEKTDLRCSFERIEGAGKTLVKLWNVARYVSLFSEPKTKPKKLNSLDEWILSELNELISFSEERFFSYDFHNPAIRLRHFIWETFASHYLELVKTRAYNSENKFSKEEQDSALFTLHYCLKNLLKLLAPIIPLMTFKIFKELYKKDVHFEEFPKPEFSFKQEFSTQELSELNSLIWKIKKDAGKSLKEKISQAIVHEKFKSLEKDLIVTHNIEKLLFADKTEIKL